MAKGSLPKGLAGLLPGSELLTQLGNQAAGGGSGRGATPYRSLLRDALEDLHAKGGKPKGGGSGGEDIATPKAGALSGGEVLNIVISGGEEVNTILGTPDVDTLAGGGGDDSIFGYGGNDTLLGQTGQDDIRGGGGIDSIFGAAGDDTLEGGFGDDFIDGGDGNDVITDGGAPVTFLSGSETLVSIAAPPEGAAPTHTDEQAYSAQRTDGSGGYITVWGQGIGAPNAPQQSLRMEIFDANGTPVFGSAGGLRVDQAPALTQLGPFETKGEIKVVGLLGPQAGKIAVVFQSELNGPDALTEFSNSYILLFNPNGTFIGYAVLPQQPGAEQSQVAPSVTALANGEIVVAWQHEIRDPGAPFPAPVLDSQIYLQKYQVVGTNLVPVGTPLEISPTDTLGANDTQPELQLLANGHVLVVYNSGIADFAAVHGEDSPNEISIKPNDDSVYDVVMRVYNPATNSFVGGEVRVNETTAGNQYIFNKSVATLTNGNIVITWTGDAGGVNGPNTTYFRIYSYNGTTLTAVTGELQASATAPNANNPHYDAAITHLQDGGFLLVWSRDNVATNDKDLIAQRFDESGARIGSEFVVSSTTALDQRRPALATLGDGTVVVTWDGGRDPDEFPTPDANFEQIYQRLIRFGGNGGHDTMLGGTGLDLIFGESGNDSLFGGLAIDSLFGASGSDTLDGGSGADTLFGGLGEDWGNYTNAAGVAVTIDLALAGPQSGIGSEGFGDVLNSIEHLYGSAFNDTLLGSSGLNSLVGNDGNDTLNGRSGADVLFGGSGGDLFIGSSGADSMHGGAGSDLADYTLSGAGVTVNLTDELAEIGGTAQGDRLTLIEAVGGSNFADILIGGAGTQTLFGNGGDDTLTGGAGGDTLHGGAGIDWASYAGSAAAVTVDLSDGAPETGGDAAGDVLTGIENLAGSNHNDILRGSAGAAANVLAGGLGDDLLRFTSGQDTLLGEGGLDTVSYDGAGAAVIVDLSLESQIFVGSLDPDDTLIGIENAVGTSLNDVIRGSSEVNTLVGGEGNDTLEGGKDADTLIGGTGLDWADYTNSSGVVIVTLGLAGAQGGGDGDHVGDLLVGIEAVRGSDINDNGDTLASLLGASILDGGLGDDVFIGGAGLDSFIGGLGSDLVDYRNSNAGVAVNLATGLGSGGHAQGDLYTEVENILGSNLDDLLIGAAGFNSFYGFDGNDTLIGGSSTDWLNGGAGDDTLIGGSGGDSAGGPEGEETSIPGDRLDGGAGDNDFVYYGNSWAAVSVNLSDELDERGGEAEGDRITGVEHLVGSDFDDQLTGNASVNRIFGESGNDSLAGGLGADSLFGGSGNDLMHFDAADAVLMGGQGRDTLIGTAGTDVLQMSQARWRFAGEFASFETILLGDGNDFFNGSTLDSDFLQLDTAVDGMVIFGGSGNDSLNMRGNTAARGNNDTVFGGEGRDNLWGGGGDDTLFGDGGDDALYGGFGSDQIYGGAGFDVTYIGRDEGEDAIFDSEGLVLFWGNEPIGGFYDGVDPTEIDIEYTDTRVIITFLGNGNSVAFDKGAVEIINLFDFGNGDAGNGAAPPPAFARDIWSASWDSGSQTFTAFTKVVDG